MGFLGYAIALSLPQKHWLSWHRNVRCCCRWGVAPACAWRCVSLVVGVLPDLVSRGRLEVVSGKSKRQVMGNSRLFPVRSREIALWDHIVTEIDGIVAPFALTMQGASRNGARLSLWRGDAPALQCDLRQPRRLSQGGVAVFEDRRAMPEDDGFG
jgi:hypothetical protein